MTFSNFNFIKSFGGKDPSELGILELLSKGFFICGLPTLELQLGAVRGKNGITDDSAVNYHLMNEESTGGIVIPPGITSSKTRNPAEEWLFRLKLPAQRQGIHGRNGILPEMTSSYMRNPPKE
jgi:hypothetical protein